MTNPFAIVVSATTSRIADEQRNRLHAVLSGKMGRSRSFLNGGNCLAVLGLADESIHDEQ